MLVERETLLVQRISTVEYNVVLLTYARVLWGLIVDITVPQTNFDLWK